MAPKLRWFLSARDRGGRGVAVRVQARLLLLSLLVVMSWAVGKAMASSFIARVRARSWAWIASLHDSASAIDCSNACKKRNRN